ncbi:hypothetical protein RIF23_19485 [Lipingzhangella sp. LS1_29]|uniref:Uncharacterized protein n=1 Tax=Lipingzhangella rawalii TaxID=2055835 RepID=A0ABU2HAX0_9ACTN|nr:hypothetical protein [Lipingzhangella rawalii]MDS1272474.1 hypothetical protein [Lipingzhangella rawalii]
MTRPVVGQRLGRCAECGEFEYGGAPSCVTCRGLVDTIVEGEWSSFLGRCRAGPKDEATFAALVTDEPDQHDWRVVDAALDRLRCPECGGPLSRGPVGCASCDRAHGFRYAAIERDQPGAPPRNEHAVRVHVSVVRRPAVTSQRELLVRRLLLPFLLTGVLPSTQEAQRISALARETSAGQRARVVERAILEVAARHPAWAAG